MLSYYEDLLTVPTFNAGLLFSFCLKLQSDNSCPYKNCTFTWPSILYLLPQTGKISKKISHQKLLIHSYYQQMFDKKFDSIEMSQFGHFLKN